MKRRDRQAGRNEKGVFLKDHKLSKINKNDFDYLVTEYCKHRANGKSKESFSLCDYRTILNNVSNLQAERVRVADCKNLELWETVCQNAAFGIDTPIQGQAPIQAALVNPSLMMFAMRAKFRNIYGDSVPGKTKEQDEEEKARRPASTPWMVYDPATQQTFDLEIGGEAE